MNERDFEKFLHENIPITKAMGLQVGVFTPCRVVIKAPLAPNINHKGTAFGGSISSLMTICGWAMVFANIKTIDPDCHIVISKSNINYIEPINEELFAECLLYDEDIKNNFINTYIKHKKSRLKLSVHCRDGEKLLAEFHGQYAVFK